jgi:hypothetical protein
MTRTPPAPKLAAKATAPELFEALTWALGRLTDTRNIAPSIVEAEEAAA